MKNLVPVLLMTITNKEYLKKFMVENDLKIILDVGEFIRANTDSWYIDDRLLSVQEVEEAKRQLHLNEYNKSLGKAIKYTMTITAILNLEVYVHALIEGFTNIEKLSKFMWDAPRDLEGMKHLDSIDINNPQEGLFTAKGEELLRVFDEKLNVDKNWVFEVIGSLFGKIPVACNRCYVGKACYTIATKETNTKNKLLKIILAQEWLADHECIVLWEDCK